MSTVTLSCDPNNALARHKLAALLSTGLFVQQELQKIKTEEHEKQEERVETEAFFAGSRRAMSNIMARYL